MFIVLPAGLAIFGIGATLLFFMFRTFGDPAAGKRRAVLMATLVTFVFACCIGFLVLSFR